jgi:hypothetical protein
LASTEYTPAQKVVWKSPETNDRGAGTHNKAGCDSESSKGKCNSLIMGSSIYFTNHSPLYCRTDATAINQGLNKMVTKIITVMGGRRAEGVGHIVTWYSINMIRLSKKSLKKPV